VSEAKIPKGYKLTEVGIIPDDWEVGRLADSAEILTGIAKNSNSTVNNPVLVHYLRVANVQDGFLDLADLSQLLVNRDDIKRYSVLPGDVLMNEGGDLDKLGRGAIWRGLPEPCVHQNHVFVVRCKASISPDYLNSWTSGSSARRYFMLAGRQTTNLASINKTSLGELPILLPKRPEQEAIAKTLSDADALIESLEQLLVKKRQIKQGAMQELLTGRRRLPRFSGKWKTMRLDEVGAWKGGMTPSMSNPDFWDGGTIHWISSGDVKRKRLTATNLQITEAAIRQNASIQVPVQSIILVMRSGILRNYLPVSMNMVPMAVNQDIKALIPDTDRSSEFLLHQIEFYGPKILNRCLKSGTTVESIEFRWLKAFEIPMPTLPEQSAIASVLSDMDAELEALENKLDKARQVKQGMMQQLLTGKIRLVAPTVASARVSTATAPQTSSGHTKVFNEAVLISVLVKKFSGKHFPLSRFRYSKFLYFFHRYVDVVAEKFKKHAAGPYNSENRHKGPEKIAIQNGYLQADGSTRFYPGPNIEKALEYYGKWYESKPLDWLEQFHFAKDIELEVYATVDMACEDLRHRGSPVSVNSVKRVIEQNALWKPKLLKPEFSDVGISKAIQKCDALFGEAQR
jgi:type I restriction enzyme, S subunit